MLMAIIISPNLYFSFFTYSAESDMLGYWLQIHVIDIDRSPTKSFPEVIVRTMIERKINQSLENRFLVYPTKTVLLLTPFRDQQ